MNALLSVYDKSGIEEFAQILHDSGFKIVSTGGTYNVISEFGLPVQQVSELTGVPEILDGRVKTLSYSIYAGILARRDLLEHQEQLTAQSIDPIDLVVVNLYPFVETINKPNVDLEEALENIDIGGPSLLRAAAKNFPNVVVLSDPDDYEWIALRLMKADQPDGMKCITLEERRELARKAFQHVSLYDYAIANYLRQNDVFSGQEATIGYEKTRDLRYGENPHQKAALYTNPLSKGGIVNAKQVHGLEMSFNNVLDADAAWKTVTDFSEQVVAIVKHTNPCGLSRHSNQAIAYKRAFEGDQVSAYGGIVGFNRRVTVATAEAMEGVFYEVVIAPSYEPDALDILRKRKRTRVIECTSPQGPFENMDIRSVTGGALFQTVDSVTEDQTAWEVVTKCRPTSEQLIELRFAWKTVIHVKSNAIVLVKDNTVVGIGVGQPNRVNSVDLALRTAQEKSMGSVLASDAFFPFSDNIDVAAKGGVTAIVQPGGSIRDAEVIAEADRLKLIMIFTGVRHFKH